MEKILVLNSGSSSLKYQLFNVDGDKFEVVAKGLADRIGIEGSLVTIKVGDGDKVTTELPLPTHKEAIKEVLDLLLGSVLKSIDELSGVGHRVVHGGEYFDRSVLVDDEVIRIIDGLSTLAPLHNPAAVMGIKAVKALLPNVPQVVAFDTAFHQTMKPPLRRPRHFAPVRFARGGKTDRQGRQNHHLPYRQRRFDQCG